MRRSKPRRDAAYRECSNRAVENYQGIRPPHCNGGKGCAPCWLKYNISRHSSGSRRSARIDPGLTTAR